MSNLASNFGAIALEKDVEEAFFQDGSLTVLAILASQGLKDVRLKLSPDSPWKVWALSVKENQILVNERLWDSLSVEFKPSDEALQCLCQARYDGALA